jgi:hypothetical protein
MIIDEVLLMTIIAGLGLSVAYLRAECVLHRGFKAAEHKKLIVLHELHAARLRLEQTDEPVASRNHQLFLSKESALCVPAESPSNIYSRKPTGAGITRHREFA